MTEALNENLEATRYCEIAIAKWREAGRSEGSLSLAMLRAGAMLLIDQVGQPEAVRCLRQTVAALEAVSDS